MTEDHEYQGAPLVPEVQYSDNLETDGGTNTHEEESKAYNADEKILGTQTTRYLEP